MTTRERLLALVFNRILSDYKARAVFEHDAARYNTELRPQGRPVARWSFDGKRFIREDYHGTPALYHWERFYFHIDGGNNRAMLVSKGGALAGCGIVLDGSTGKVISRWML